MRRRSWVDPSSERRDPTDYCRYRNTEELTRLIAANPPRVTRDTVVGRVMLARQPIHIPDLMADSEYRYPDFAGDENGFGRALLREGTPIGVIIIFKSEVEPFTDKQIELVNTFADQAVIAIENVRLFQELKESLEQQTATSEILGVIASSPTEIQPVMDTIAENAAKVCGANDAVIRLVKENVLRTAAHYDPCRMLRKKDLSTANRPAVGRAGPGGDPHSRYGCRGANRFFAVYDTYLGTGARDGSRRTADA